MSLESLWENATQLKLAKPGDKVICTKGLQSYGKEGKTYIVTQVRCNPEALLMSSIYDYVLDDGKGKIIIGRARRFKRVD